VPPLVSHAYHSWQSAKAVAPLAIVAQAVTAAFATSPARAADVKIEFRDGGRCTVTMHDESSRSERVADVPGPASSPSEYRCAIGSPPRGHPIDLSVILPQGEGPVGAEFPRLTWAERGGHWIGTASLPAAPSFVRVPKSGSAAPRRARLLDWAALAATAIAVAWTIKFGIRN
jgi:hypothetical protein